MDWAGYIGGYMYIHMYMHIYVQVINEKRRHDFEWLFGGVCGKFAGMKGKGKCNYSVISKIEKKQLLSCYSQNKSNITTHKSF